MASPERTSQRAAYVERLFNSSSDYDTEFTTNTEHIFLATEKGGRLHVWTTSDSLSDVRKRRASLREPIFEDVKHPTYGSYMALKDGEVEQSTEILQPQNINIVHLRQSNSWSPLLVSKYGFEHVMQQLNIFPRLKDMVLYMGRRECEVEVAPLPLQSQVAFPRTPGSSTIELCYCIRYVQQHGRDDTFTPWSLRQAVVYNRTTSAQASTWMFLSLPDFLQTAFNE